MLYSKHGISMGIVSSKKLSLLALSSSRTYEESAIEREGVYVIFPLAAALLAINRLLVRWKHQIYLYSHWWVHQALMIIPNSGLHRWSVKLCKTWNKTKPNKGKKENYKEEKHTCMDRREIRKSIDRVIKEYIILYEIVIEQNALIVEVLQEPATWIWIWKVGMTVFNIIIMFKSEDLDTLLPLDQKTLKNKNGLCTC